MVHPWADFNDLDTHHYPTYLTGVARFTNGYKVFMLPNSCMPCTIREAVPDYVTFGIVGARTPCLPEALSGYSVTKPPKRSDKGGILDSDKSNAPDGVVGPRREKEGSYYAIRAQWSPIQLKTPC